MYLNKAMVFGNITRDPELRALPSGMNVCSFSVATNRVYRDRDGKKQEQADFHNVVVFGRQADVVAQYLKKGSSVFVEGRMQTRSWEGKDGEKKYRTEIVADRVQFGPRGMGGGSGGGGGPRQSEDSLAGQAGPAHHDEAPAPSGAGIEYPKDDINPDDIPF
ncbi:MAG: Single-stranded DNA-binding protein [Candidatus Kaiserbacteria bacterium GW2011_GWA2_52_12]|uniref:Single-stranded DNA-binding protein n=1 Tax=Candidatus Kaiserbacteria bacterium GW2011_GWA2_52_12 TaxID=1618671 RepID=A0A0G1Z729_9BACT|nr:MAG: Single-stranded DNA-binding protein [Candidatus Kaiserbacteria bacterium GW2011_GWA2_52_12]